MRNKGRRYQARGVGSATVEEEGSVMDDYSNISPAEFVRIIENSTKRPTKFKRVAKESWFALCPFHNEKTGSFHVWRGRNGAFCYCQGCTRGGSVKWWLKHIEGAPVRKETIEERRARERERAQEEQLKRIERMFFDAYPHASPEWGKLIIRELR
jgi:DNA primase